MQTFETLEVLVLFSVITRLSIWVSSYPDFPTKGSFASSSSPPGASPTIMSGDDRRTGSTPAPLRDVLMFPPLLSVSLKGVSLGSDPLTIGFTIALVVVNPVKLKPRLIGGVHVFDKNPEPYPFFAHSNTTILVCREMPTTPLHTGIRLIQWIFLDAYVPMDLDWGQNKVSLICL